MTLWAPRNPLTTTQPSPRHCHVVDPELRDRQAYIGGKRKKSSERRDPEVRPLVHVRTAASQAPVRALPGYNVRDECDLYRERASPRAARSAKNIESSRPRQQTASAFVTSTRGPVLLVFCLRLPIRAHTVCRERAPAPNGLPAPNQSLRGGGSSSSSPQKTSITLRARPRCLLSEWCCSPIPLAKATHRIRAH